ncbi:MAG: adaptor protein MecA [Clostridia bacterium]|nr:adaptor protein MecA [Clostridia bacterium]
MELIVISDSKLKIMLTSEDLREYSLDCSTFDYENTETRRAFWSILDEAKHRTGFDAASEKVFVQVYPSKKGGCEMYVTKLGMFSDRTRIRGNLSDGEEDIRISERSGGGSMKKCTQITEQFREDRFASKRKRAHAFRFEKMETLLCACRRLEASGYPGDSSAYLGDGGCYLLLNDERDDYFADAAESFVAEYAEELDAAAFGIYIGEHGKCICEHDAVETLGALS